MFNKKCPKCDRKISKDYDFCPYCGTDFRMQRRFEKEKDYGFLGKDDDLMPAMPNFNVHLPGGINTLFNSLLKEVDKQFRELDKEMSQEIHTKKPVKSSGISINISAMNNGKPEIKVKTFGPDFKSIPAEKSKEITIQKPRISEEDAKRISKLPKKEAEASVRRLSNKIIYEIELPGIKNLKDVIINKLENSVEIKAFSKKTAYFKLIPVNLPVVNYRLDKEKLILEFGTK